MQENRPFNHDPSLLLGVAKTGIPRLSTEFAVTPAEPDKLDDVEFQSLARERSNLPLAPQVIVEALGTADQRKQVDANVLKKAQPLERLFGYAKEYIHQETSRLADGYKRLTQQREQLVVVFEDAVRKRDQLLDDLMRLHAKDRARLVEVGRKLRDVEARAAELRKQAGLAKGKVAQNEDALARAALVEEEAKRREEETRKEVGGLQKELAEANKRVASAEHVSKATVAKHKAAQDALTQATLEHDKLVQLLKADYERQAAALAGRSAAADEHVARLNEQISSLAASKSLLEAEVASVRSQVEKAMERADHWQGRCEDAQSQLRQADGKFDTLAGELRDKSNYLKTRVDELGAEKRALEERVEALLGEAKAQVQRAHEAESTVMRLQDRGVQLAEKIAGLEQRLAEQEARNADAERRAAEQAKEHAAAMDDARAEATRHLLSVNETRNQLEAALQQGNAERARAQQLGKEATAHAERADRTEQELAVVKIAMANAQRTSGTSAPDLAALMEHAQHAAAASRKENESASARSEIARLQHELEETTKRLAKAEAMRRALHEEVQSLKGNIRVVTRIRPPHSAPPAGPSELRVSVDGSSLTLDVAGDQLRRTTDKPDSHAFAFNRVFAPDASQHDVFDEVASFVQSALDGFSVCLFSYGQTGSGKSFTMMGDQTSPLNRGIVPRAVDQILCAIAELRQSGWEYAVQVSYLEIYNEVIRDLLAVDFRAEKQAKHEIVNNGGDVYAKGVRRVPVSDAEQVHALLSLASQNRAVAHTDKNHESSRSHSIFSMHLVGRNTRGKTSELVGSLSLCDLAGSERLKTSNAQGDRLAETQGINSSLSALSTVFNALAQKTLPSFRSNPLTHLLSPCLSGDGKTLMIVNVSPDHCDAAETLCSLRFAQTVNKTELGKAKKNVREVAAPPAVKDARSRVNSMPAQ